MFTPDTVSPIGNDTDVRTAQMGIVASYYNESGSTSNFGRQQMSLSISSIPVLQATVVQSANRVKTPSVSVNGNLSVSGNVLSLGATSQLREQPASATTPEAVTVFVGGGGDTTDLGKFLSSQSHRWIDACE